MRRDTKTTPGLGRRSLLCGLVSGAGLAAIGSGLSPAFLRAPLAYAGALLLLTRRNFSSSRPRIAAIR
jgi:hypothetical protein